MSGSLRANGLTSVLGFRFAKLGQGTRQMTGPREDSANSPMVDKTMCRLIAAHSVYDIDEFRIGGKAPVVYRDLRRRFGGPMRKMETNVKLRDVLHQRAYAPFGQTALFNFGNASGTSLCIRSWPESWFLRG
jgi:hypothetical protein